MYYLNCPGRCKLRAHLGEPLQDFGKEYPKMLVGASLSQEALGISTSVKMSEEPDFGELTFQVWWVVKECIDENSGDCSKDTPCQILRCGFVGFVLSVYDGKCLTMHRSQKAKEN